MIFTTTHIGRLVVDVSEPKHRLTLSRIIAEVLDVNSPRFVPLVSAG